ncbi:MAG: hypothetical protein R3F56_16710 [Planctomycetota bacterium]
MNRPIRWLALLVLPVALGTPRLLAPTDIQQPGTQPNEVSPLPGADNCDNCHGGYDRAVEPTFQWRGSPMAHAARDPVFWAALAITEQDFTGAGDLCLRCHTPRGWLEGRSAATDGSLMTNADVDGTECAICHGMVNPDESEHAGVQNPPYLANDEGSPPTGYYGSGMFVLWPGNERFGPYTDAVARHQWLPSRFHRSPDFCGTCHDVSNPLVGDLAHNNGAPVPLAPGSFSGIPGAPVQQKAAFNNFPYLYGVVERTYSEAKASALTTTRVSAFPSLPAELQAGALRTAYDAAVATGVGGDYADGTLRTFTCQTCHMPPVTGQGCKQTNAPTRRDLPLHDMTGVNYWIADAIVDEDNRNVLRLGGGLNQLQVDALRAGQGRARAMLEGAAVLRIDGDALRVVNLTAHKVISGYPEGRRMWLGVEWFDAFGNLLREDGAYGPITVQLDGQPVQVDTLRDLAGTGTRIYEAKYGLTQEWAQQLLGLGLPPALPLAFDRVSGAVTLTLAQLAARPPGSAAASFHFALLNTVLSDNRIPPYGMAYDQAGQRNVRPLPDTLYGNPGPGGTYDHFDVVTLSPPAGAVGARVRLRYQPMTWEYAQFLYLANDGSVPFLAAEGRNLLETWRATGMAAPHTMATTTWCGMRGTGEDVALSSEVDGGGDPGLCVKPARAGASVGLSLLSPDGTLTGALGALLLQVHATGSPPPPLPLPGLWLGRFDLQVVLGGIPNGGVGVTLTVPPGAAGATLRVQGLALSTLARNGLYALTEAHDVVLR